MRACIQRVSSASVTVDRQVVGEIGRGLLVLLGVHGEDSDDDARQLAERTCQLRIFPDDQGKMNLSVEDVQGEMLIVSQFTLLGDCRKGRRPSFVAAAGSPLGEQLYQRFIEQVGNRGIPVAMGVFGAQMDVALTNDGPVTLLLDSRKFF